MYVPAEAVFLHVCTEGDVLLEVGVECWVVALACEPSFVFYSLPVVDVGVMEDVESCGDECEHPQQTG